MTLLFNTDTYQTKLNKHWTEIKLNNDTVAFSCFTSDIEFHNWLILQH